MGMSAEAGVGFGWAFDEDDEQDIEEIDGLWDSDILSLQHDGHIDGATRPILVWKESYEYTYYAAKPLKLSVFEANLVEAKMRKAAMELGIELPDEKPQWLLWSYYG